MSFEMYLRHTTEELSNRQTVGLAMYYLLEEEQRVRITASDVRDFLEHEPVSIPDTNIVAYPSQLAGDGLFDSNGDGYILTVEGSEHFKDKIDLPSDSVDPREDRFLVAVEPDDEFYISLVEDIEATHTHRIYDATLVLTRKLLENLVIDILRGHYGTGASIGMYFDTDRGQFKPFSDILDNFENNTEDFKPYSLELGEPEFFNNLNEFREVGNASAHSITVDVSEIDIEELSEVATETVSLLLRIKTQVEAAPDDWKNP